MDADIIATLLQENDTLRVNEADLQKKVKELHLYSQELNVKLIDNKKKLLEEEEISQILSKRIEILEEENYKIKMDFRTYVEKMQIYLQTEYDGPVKEENDEIVFEKPNLARSTNQHEWTRQEKDIIYSLEY